MRVKVTPCTLHATPGTLTPSLTLHPARSPCTMHPWTLLLTLHAQPGQRSTLTLALALDITLTLILHSSVPCILNPTLYTLTLQPAPCILHTAPHPHPPSTSPSSSVKVRGEESGYRTQVKRAGCSVKVQGARCRVYVEREAEGEHAGLSVKNAGI